MGIIRIIWMISMFVPLGLLISTALFYMPPTLDLAGFQMSKDLYFYGWVAIITIMNFMFMLLSRILQGVPASKIPMPARSFWMESRKHLELFHENLKYWLRGIALGLNLLLTSLIFTVYSFYDPYINHDTTPLMVGLLVLTMGWVLAYFPLFSFLAKDLAEQQ